MMEPLVRVVFPVIGISIIAFCLLSYLFPYGGRIKEKTQKIKGFGVDLEVSVVSLFTIIGIAFSFTGIYLYVKDYKSDVVVAKNARDSAIQELREEKKKLLQAEKMHQEALRNAKRFQMTITVKLEGVEHDDESPNADDLKAQYVTTDSSPDSVTAKVISGVALWSYRVLLQDISRNTHVKYLIIEEIDDPHRKWILHNFMPLEPSFSLEAL